MTQGVTQPQELPEPPRLGELARGIGLRVRRHQERPITERVLRRPGEERRVHAAPEGHDHAVQSAEDVEQLRVLRPGHWSGVAEPGGPPDVPYDGAGVPAFGRGLLITR